MISGSLDRKVLDQFYRDGYVILRNKIPKEVIQALEEDVLLNYFMINQHNEVGQHNEEDLDKLILEAECSGRFQELYEIYKENLELVSFHKIITTIAEFGTQLLGTKNLLIIAKGIMVGIPGSTRSSYDWHQESAYTSENRRGAIHFQFPIFRPVDESLGTMSVLAGSHKEGHLDYVIKQVSNHVKMHHPVQIGKMVEKYENVPFLMNRGDVAVFHHHLIHRSNLNSTTKVRYVGVARLGIPSV